MINKLKHTVKKWSDGLIKTVMVVGTTLFIMLNVGVHKTNAEVKKEIGELLKDKRYTDKEIVIQENDQKTEDTEKTAKFEAVGDTTNALDFVSDNVSKYYPEMKQHVDSLINNFRDQEQKDTVNFLFQEYVFKNISDPQKQVASIMYCIENFVFKGVGISKTFSNTYRISEIVNKTEYANLFAFNKGYNKRFKWYYMKLEKTIVTMKEQNEKMKEQNEKMKKELEQLKLENQQLKKETEGIINTFTANDVRTNPQVKKLILDVEELYIFADYEIYPHLAELIKAAKE